MPPSRPPPPPVLLLSPPCSCSSRRRRPPPPPHPPHHISCWRLLVWTWGRVECTYTYVRTYVECSSIALWRLVATLGIFRLCSRTELVVVGAIGWEVFLTLGANLKTWARTHTHIVASLTANMTCDEDSIHVSGVGQGITLAPNQLLYWILVPYRQVELTSPHRFYSKIPSGFSMWSMDVERYVLVYVCMPTNQWLWFVFQLMEHDKDVGQRMKRQRQAETIERRKTRNASELRSTWRESSTNCVAFNSILYLITNNSQDDCTILTLANIFLTLLLEFTHWPRKTSQHDAFWCVPACSSNSGKTLVNINIRSTFKGGGWSTSTSSSTATPHTCPWIIGFEQSVNVSLELASKLPFRVAPHNSPVQSTALCALHYALHTLQRSACHEIAKWTVLSSHPEPAQCSPIALIGWKVHLNEHFEAFSWTTKLAFND